VGSAIVTEGELAAWGASFAATLGGPVVVGLSGELGAGKTTLVRAISAALGVTERVTSPTFALVHRYAGRDGPVYHVDAYRLRSTDEARDLGFEEMLREAGAVVLIEWPERLAGHGPALDHLIRLAYTGDPTLREVATG
jgi:tRNA threonylcarbamoyladenosine biosynthesis protein TsaE